MTYTLLANDDCTWKLYICGHEVRPITDDPLSTVPIILNQESFINLYLLLIDVKCVQDILMHMHFIELGKSRKGKFETACGEIKARIEDGFPLMLNESVHISFSIACHVQSIQSK